MRPNHEKLIELFVNKRILTGVDLGLRRAVTELYSEYKILNSLKPEECVLAGQEVKCRIQRYTPGEDKAPFSFITLDQCIVTKPEVDYLGETFWLILNRECRKLGFDFKFYSMSDSSDFVYDITVK